MFFHIYSLKIYTNSQKLWSFKQSLKLSDLKIKVYISNSIFYAHKFSFLYYLFVVSQGEYRDTAVKNISTPPQFDPGEDVNITMTYTPDILNEPFQSLASYESSCSSCIKLQTSSYRYPLCTGDGFARCMGRYYIYNEAIKATTECQDDNSVTFEEILSPCLGKSDIDSYQSINLI